MSHTPALGPLGYPLHHYHLGRTVQWGHWGITFSEAQPDERKNFGVIVAHWPFPVNANGPQDGTRGSPQRAALQQACDAWIADGVLPAAARECDTSIYCASVQRCTRSDSGNEPKCAAAKEAV